MIKIRLNSLILAVVLFALTVAPSFALAETYPDQFEVGPNIYTKQFENEKVRVSEIKFNPGDEIGMHTHAYDHFVYILEAGKLELSYPDGAKKEVDGTVGQVMWMPKESHAAKNVGTTTLRALVVELKS